MSIDLRGYQADLVEKIRVAFKRHRRVLVQAPTGSGKTVLFGYIAEAAAERGKRVLILVHRHELLKQASEKLHRPHGLIKAGVVPDHRQPIQIASVQTLVKRLWQYRFDLIIIDEAHHTPAGSYRIILDAYPGAHVLGVTATPCRSNGGGLKEMFDTLIIGPTVRKLTERGFLSPAIVYVPSKIDTGSVHTRMGDFVKSELNAAADKPTITGNAITHYRRYADQQPAIAFCVSVAHSEHVAAEFRHAGYTAQHVDGKMSQQERDAALAGLADGSINVVTSCDLISEGVDVPVVSCGIMLRPTQSKGLFLQQVGRCLRPAPGKTHAVILDHAGNCARHGMLPDTEIQWTLDGDKDVQKRLKGKNQGRIRECPKCYAAFESTRTCPECRFELPVQERTIEEVDGELVEIQQAKQKMARRRQQGRAQTLEELTALGVERGYKRPEWWARKVLYARGIAV